MPNWQPNWDPVRWDHDAANQAIAMLERAAGDLQASIDDRRIRADAARREWYGRHRNTFDMRHDDGIRNAEALVADYQEAIRHIRRTSEEAREEQHRRWRDQERWRREKQDEERREREEQERRRREAEQNRRR